MGLLDDVGGLDATAQAALVRKKEVSPTELVEAAIPRTEALNPRLNAVVTPMYDAARAAARGPIPDGPLFLLPVLAASTALAQKTMDNLCRTHGLDGDDSIRQIEGVYVEAVKAGISEEELLPFLEDILKHKLDCGQMVRVLVVTIRLRNEGLPYYVVFSKVREGVAKEAPPALVVDAAEAKFRTLSGSRVVLESLGSLGYGIRDYQNAAVVVSSYIEKGYTSEEIVSQIRNKGMSKAFLPGIAEDFIKRTLAIASSYV